MMCKYIEYVLHLIEIYNDVIWDKMEPEVKEQVDLVKRVKIYRPKDFKS